MFNTDELVVLYELVIGELSGPSRNEETLNGIEKKLRASIVTPEMEQYNNTINDYPDVKDAGIVKEYLKDQWNSSN